MKESFLIFHLNLCFSSIPVNQRSVVINKCYYPLLDLIEEMQIPAGVELTGYTLKEIQRIDPTWVSRFSTLLKEKKCELIGSGYAQIIGPLVPHQVNIWNQQLGLNEYISILGIRPRICLVNEMAYSSGMLNVYRESGYEGIVMDRDNVLLAKEAINNHDNSLPSYASDGKNKLPVLWSDSILFQKLQRYTHGDITKQEYIEHFINRSKMASRPMAIYCNDAEVFDYRPGRYKEELSVSAEGEWIRMKALFYSLRSEGVNWLSPSAALCASVQSDPESHAKLSSITYPIPVKKQTKYNISRWAISGRNDMWINTICYRIAKKIASSKNESHWKLLCELWSSDFRTHITEERWLEAERISREFCSELGLSSEFEKREIQEKLIEVDLAEISNKNNCNEAITNDNEGIYITFETEHLKLILNKRRGLSIKELTIKKISNDPIIGTIDHGYFDSIIYGADFYSGAIVIEIPSHHQRITDLSPVTPIISECHDAWTLRSVVSTQIGEIQKTYKISKINESISLSVHLKANSNFQGIVRAPTITFLPGVFNNPLIVTTINGGEADEHFPIDREFNHAASSSNLVSCNAGFGATTGRITVGDALRAVNFMWNPDESAIFPMMINHKTTPNDLTRLVFSLSELDDTSKTRFAYPEFTLNISANHRNLMNENVP